MLDMRDIRERKEEVAANLTHRNLTFDLEALLEADRKAREAKSELDGVRRRRNEVAGLMKAAPPDGRPALVEEGRALKERESRLAREYRSADAEPAAIPGTVAVAFDDVSSDFGPLGFVPQGQVYFSYGIAVSDDGSGFTADAGADIDGDGFIQYWGYANPDNNGTLVAGEVGCDVTAGILPKVVGPCTLSSGQSIF